jgi:hypothetical protein
MQAMVIEICTVGLHVMFFRFALVSTCRSGSIQTNFGTTARLRIARGGTSCDFGTIYSKAVNDLLIFNLSVNVCQARYTVVSHYMTDYQNKTLKTHTTVSIKQWRCSRDAVSFRKCYHGASSSMLYH